MKIVATSIVLLLLLAIPGSLAAGEPLTNLKEHESLLGIWTAESELSADHPLLGKQGTEVTYHATMEWGPGKKSIIRRESANANGKSVFAGLYVFHVDHGAKKLVVHFFTSDGGHARGEWYRDARNSANLLIHLEGSDESGRRMTAVSIVTSKSYFATRHDATRPARSSRRSTPGSPKASTPRT